MLNAATGTVLYTPNNDINGSDSFVFQVNDGKLGITDATESLTITPVNQQPVSPGTTAATNENTAVQIFLPASDVETPQPDLTYNLVTGPQNGTLTIGPQGLWTYTPSPYFYGTDSFTYSVTDRGDPDGSYSGVLTSAPGTVNITVRHVNQPPALAPIGTTIGTTQNALQVNEGTPLSFTVVGSDPDSGATLVYSLVNNTVSGASINSSTGAFTWTPPVGPATQSFTVQVLAYGTLAAQETFNVIVAHVPPTVTLAAVPAGDATVRAGQTYTVSFSATEVVSTHTVSGWSINWGDGTSNTYAGTATGANHVYALGGSYDVVATATDDVGSYASQPLAVQVTVPALTGSGNAATFTQGGAAVVASPALGVVDVGSATLASASVTISSGYFAGDLLAAVTAGTAITANYNPSTGVLALTGTDTLANYQTVLDSVTFNSTSINPTNYGTDLNRTLSWQISDATLTSNAVNTKVIVVGVDQAPVLAGAGNTVTFNQGGAPVAASPGVTISDVDSLDMASATVSIGSGFLSGDVLAALVTGTSIGASYNASTGVLTLSGLDTLAHYQTVLDAVTFSSGSSNPTNSGADLSRTLSWQVFDGTLNSNTVTSNVTVVPVAEAPIISGAGNTVTFTQGGGATATSPAITLTDVDSLTLASATVSISSGFFAGDALAAVTTGTNIVASYNAATGVLSLIGKDTLANYQTVLDSVTFNSTSANPTSFGTDTSRGLSWAVNDGTLGSNTVTSNVTVAGVDQAPVLAGAGNTVTFTQGGAAVTASSGITVSDADNLTLASATVSIAAGFLSGDVLSTDTTGTSISASYNATTGVLTLTGSDTVANYQQVLESVTFSSTSLNPTNYGTDTSRGLSWQVNDGTLNSSIVTSNVTVVGVDQAPVLSGAGNTVTFTQGGTAVAASPTLTVSDVDSLDLASATVSIGTGFLAGDTLAAATAGTTINASYDAVTGVLTLSGSDTVAHYQTVLDSVTFSSTSGNPTSYGTDLSRGLSWQVNDGTLGSNTVTSNVTVVGVDQAPVLSGAGNTATFTQAGAAVAASSGIMVSDVDSLDLASATVSIGTGFLAGDTLAAATTGTTISASYNAGTGVLTLSGSDTVAHYQQVLESVTFSSASGNPTSYGTDLSRGLSWQVNDGTLGSNTVTSNVTVAGVDQAPVLSGAGNTVTFTQGGAAVVASSGISASDVDSLDLASATVSIGTGFLVGDTLAAVTTGTTISASYNAGTGVLTLSGSDTVAHYQTVLDSVTFSSASANPTNYGTDVSRSLSWQVNDGTLNSNTASSNVTVVGVDQAPVLSGAGNTVTFTQGGAAVAASPGITVSDVDSLDLASATVSIGTGFLTGDTLAAATTGTSINASYNAGTGVLTLSGSDTVAHYQQVLESVTYSSGSANPTSDGTDVTRGLSWQVNDGALDSNTVASNVTVVGVATAPILAGAGNTVTFTQGGGAVVASSGVTVSDADSLTLASASISITSGFVAGDVLGTVTTGTSISASYNAATGVLTLSGTDTLANYQTVLDSVTFHSTSANPTNYGANLSRGLSWQVNDGTLNSNTAASNVTVVGVDQAPVLAGAGNTVTFTQGGAAVVASPSIAVSDVDSLDLASATVTIGTGFLAGDTLAAATAGTTISANYDAGTGILTLSGSDTVAHYQQVLGSVTFSSSSANPTNFGADTSRGLSWQVNDGTLASNTVTSNVTVAGVDQAPVLSGAGNTVTFTQGGAAVVASPGVTVSDFDSLDLASATVSISTGFFAGDTLAAATAGTTISANYDAGTGILTLSGSDTVAHYQQVLDSVTFSSSSANPTNYGVDTSRGLSWQVNDGTLASNTVASNVTVAGVDQAPVLAAAGNTVTKNHGGAPVVASSSITVSDVDNLTLASATVSIGSGFLAGDTLAAVTTGTSISTSYNASTGVLTLSGTDTLANYQTVLDSVTFSSTSGNPTIYGTDLSRSLSWQVNDGTLNSNTAASTIAVVGVDQAPVLSGAGNTVTFTQGGAPVVVSPSITVSDVDNLTLASATVSIGTGFLTGDALAAVTTGTSISESYNASTGVLTLSGSDTLANYQAVLDSVTFSSTSANPTIYGTDLSRSLSWQVNDGTLNSNTAASTVAVVGVDQAPVLSGAGNTVTFTQGGSPVVASSGVAVSDVDSLDLASATVSIGTGFLAGDTLAAVTTGTSISASYNASTGVLTLSGSDTLANYQTVLDSVIYSSGSANPTNFGADTSRALSWQVNDGTLNSNTVTSTVTVVAVAEAPIISGAGNTVTFTQGGGAVVASPSITVTDVDSPTLASATVSISSGFFAGDVLAAVTTGTSISAGYNASTGVLTLSGGDTLANYQTVLDSVTFNSASANPTNYGSDTSRGLSWQVNDGTLNSNTVSSNVTVVGVDQAPVLSGAGNTVTFTQGGAVVAASAAIAVSDADSLNLASATVSIGTGFLAGDTLAAVTTGTSISASYNAGTGVLTLSGSDTVANYQTVLESVTFSSASANPTSYGTDLSRALSWQVNDGTLNSNTVTSTVIVVGVDQAPVLSGAGNTVTFTQEGTAVIASPGITVADVDNLNLASATVSISSGYFAGDTLAAATTGTTITASYSAGTGVLTLSGSDTLANYQAVLDSVTFSSSNADPTNSGTDFSRTLTWQANDGTLPSNTVTSNVTVVAAASKPSLSGAGNTVTFTQGGAPITASPGVTITGSLTLASATVSIGSGFFIGDVLGTATTGTNITANYDASAGVLTLTGNDTEANYQTVLDSVTFSSTSANPTNFNGDLSRGLSWQVNDGKERSNTVASTVTVVGVDQAPVLAGAGNTVTYTQGGAAVVASSGITVSDADNLNLASATVSIGTGFLSGDVLAAATTGTTITASYNTATGVLSLSGSDTVANYQTVLDSVTFTTTSPNPTSYGTDLSRGLTWQVNDGTLNSNTVSSSVTVVGVDQAPVLSGAGNTVTFTEGGAAVAASPTLTVSDVDSLDLASATVSIGTGFLAGDTLAAVTTGTSISASYNTTTGVLTLSGSDTVAHYQTVLDSVTFSSTSGNPTSYGTDLSRGLSWQVNDGTLGSNTVTSNVTVVGVDQAPVLSGAGNTVTFTQGGAAVVASPGITVSDVDNLNLASATVSVSTGFLTGDTLAAATTGTSIIASYNTATGVLTLTGSDTVAHYQSVLDSVTYISTSANPTNSGADLSRALSWQVNDGTLNSNTVTSSVTVVASTGGPVLAGAGNTVTYTQAGARVIASPSLTVTDTESTTLASASVSISSGFFAGDTLSATTGGTGITATYNAATGVLTLTGKTTLAHYQTVLESVRFSSTSVNPTDFGADSSRTLTWQANDGTRGSNAVTSTVTVVGVDQAPVLAGAGNTVTFTQLGAPVVASPAITISDVDNLNLASATVSISAHFFAGDTLAATTAGTAITVSYNAATGVLTLTGSDTLANYQKVLDSVTFSSVSANPTNDGRDLSRTIAWTVNDGTRSSNTLHSTVTVVGVDQAPVLAGAGNTVTYTQAGAHVVASPTITATDVDSLDLASATVSISSGLLAGDTLTAAAATGITETYNAATGVLTLTGSAPVARYQTVLESVRFSSTSLNPTSYGTDTSRTLTWQVNDGTLNSNAVTSSVTVAGVDQAPVLSGAGNTVTFTQGGAPVVATSTVAAADVDNLNLASATVSVSTGFFAGDTLTAVTAGTVISASYNAATGVLTLSGSDTLAHYQQVLNSVTYASTSANPTNDGRDLTRTLAWTVNDGKLNSNTLHSTVNVVGVDQAPVLGGAGNTVTYTAGGARVAASPAITATDVDSLNLASATVSIASGFLAGDTLAATAGGGITASYNATTGVLTLTGSSTVAHYQTVLESVTFRSTSTNATNGGTDLSRTLTWVVNDGTLNSNTVTSTVTVQATAPAVVSTAGATPAFLAPSGAGTSSSVSLPTATASLASASLAGPGVAASTAAPAAQVATAQVAAPTAQVAQSKGQMLANARLSMGSLSAAAGSSVTVPVSISSARGLQSMHLVVRYDARALTPVSIEPSALTSGFSYTVGVVRPGELRIEATHPRPLAAGSGALFGLKFALAPTAAGKFSVDFASASLNGNRLMVRDPNEGAIIVKANNAPTAAAKPAISLNQPARSFELSNGKTHAWLDEFLKPSDGKNGKANSWTVVVKPRTLH